MSDKTFRLEILTPERAFFSGMVVSLVAPGTIGSLGILANHAPLMTTLVTGKVTFRDPAGTTQTLRSTGGGFLDVASNRAVVLADEILLGSDPEGSDPIRVS